MRTSSRARLHAGVLVMMVSWVAAAVRSPTGVFAGEAWRYLFGRTSAPTFTGFPLIPWLGVYLLATVLGERLAKHARTPDAGRDESLLLRLGAGAMAFGLTITIVRHALRAYAPTLVTGAGLILIAKSFSFARSEALATVLSDNDSPIRRCRGPLELLRRKSLSQRRRVAHDPHHQGIPLASSYRARRALTSAVAATGPSASLPAVQRLLHARVRLSSALVLSREARR